MFNKFVLNIGNKPQARYFKGILRDADHLDKVKRIRVGEKELAPLLSDYEACTQFSMSIHDSLLICC